jgi:hypothetical protein
MDAPLMSCVPGCRPLCKTAREAVKAQTLHSALHTVSLTIGIYIQLDTVSSSCADPRRCVHMGEIVYYNSRGGLKIDCIL